MSIEQVLTTNVAGAVLAVSALWFFSLLRRDASIIDIFWGLGFVGMAWLSVWQSGGTSPRSWLLLLLISLWGLRLSGYLAWRNWRKPEDYRYVAMRQRHGSRFPIVSLFTVFGLQGVLLWFVSLPIQVGVARGQDWSALALLGASLWATGFFFESVGDWQLSRFKADPANRGKVMNRGLWRYTRHPNYFGDFLVWWGLYFLAAEPASWWWTLSGPLLMSWLLIRVSGVRLLENSLRGRVDGYEEYTHRTSSFVPMPPRPVAPRR